MKQATLLFLRRDDRILLAMKKRGLGQGKWNGVGGKVESTETIEEALARETREEINVIPKRISKVAEFNFTYMYVHVFLCTSWEGEPTESDEMAPRWFQIKDIPFEEMWDDDKIWLPRVLNGEKLNGWFKFNDANKVIDYSISKM
jgi:mutator protein MutT